MYLSSVPSDSSLLALHHLNFIQVRAMFHNIISNFLRSQDICIQKTSTVTAGYCNRSKYGPLGSA